MSIIGKQKETPSLHLTESKLTESFKEAEMNNDFENLQTN